MSRVFIPLDPQKSDAELLADIQSAIRRAKGKKKVAKHSGPGPHPGTGTDQSVHGRGGAGSDIARPGIDDNPDIVQAAQARRVEGEAVDKEVYPLLQSVAEQHGGQLAGTEFRLKTERSIRRKIAQDALEKGIDFDQAAAEIRDITRYTVTFEPDESFTAKFESVMSDLESAGWSIYDHKAKNYFGPGDHYDGINLQLTNGSQFFELQVHTPASFKIKQESHELYARLRLELSEDERKEAITGMYDLWNSDTSHIPPGTDALGYSASMVLKRLIKADGQYYILSADGETPQAIFRCIDGRVERWADGWVESTYTVPQVEGFGGSSDFSLVSQDVLLGLLGDEEPESSPDFVADIEIAKSDDYKNLVFGWASVAFTEDGTQMVDRQGDVIDIEDLEDAAYDFVVRGHGTGDMHQSEEFGHLVESVVLTKEKAKVMGLPEGPHRQGWWVGFKVPPEYHEMVRSGKRTMFSIEGTAKREPIPQ